MTDASISTITEDLAPDPIEILNGLALLRQPFEEHQIGKLPKPTTKDGRKSDCRICGGYHQQPAIHLDYVGHAALTDRFLDVDPRWTWEPFAVGPDGLPALDRNGGLWIRLNILGMTRIGYGDAGGKSGGNAVKEAIGDALRNAGMRFGAALDLWHKGDLKPVQQDDDQQTPDAMPEPTPADILRRLILSTMREKGIDPTHALEKFAADNLGANIETSTDEAALQSLLDFYRAESTDKPDPKPEPEKAAEPTDADKARVALRETINFLGLAHVEAVEKFAADNPGQDLKTSQDKTAVLKLLTYYRGKTK